MPTLTNPAHEAFAQARFAGKSLADAYEAAGLTGGKTTACNLNRLPAVRERVAELYRGSAARAVYEKTSAVRDLIAIIHAAPSEAAPDHPLCEQRMGKDGPYHRFPPKLQAMARLIRLMGWIEPAPLESGQKDYFTELLADIRSGRRPRPATIPIPSSPSRQAQPAAPSLAASPGDTTSEAPPWVKLLPDDASYEGHPDYAHGELTPRQEAFAQFRFQGRGVMEAYHAAGYKGDTPNLAWRLSSKPAVRARIAELNCGVACAIGYSRADAAQDLVTIIVASPSAAGPDHPYCEMRMTSWGPYHRFPSKLAAITLLARMLGWHTPPGRSPAPHDPNAGFKSLALSLAARS